MGEGGPVDWALALHAQERGLDSRTGTFPDFVFL